MKFIETIPKEVLEAKKGVVALEAGFGAGPSCVAGLTQKFSPPVLLEEALEWLENYRTPMRAGHVLLADNTILWFRPQDGYTRHETRQKGEPLPRPGVTVELLEKE